jgi:tetratricopeptide (TPR) repeat protein
MKKYNESIDYFNKSIELYPKFHMAYYNMANVYKDMKKLD